MCLTEKSAGKFDLQNNRADPSRSNIVLPLVSHNSLWIFTKIAVLTQHQVIFPLYIIFEIDPGAHGMKIVHYHRDTFPITDYVMMSWQKIETLVIDLAVKKRKNIVLIPY